MNCREVDTILDDHSIRSLSAAQRTEVDAHLGKCRRCSDAWLGYEVLANDSPGAPRRELFDETLARVLTEQSVPTPTARSGRLAPSLGLAAALVVVAVAASLVTHDAGVPTTRGVESGGRGEVTADRAPPPSVASAGLSSIYVAGRDYQRLPTPAPTASTAGTVEVCEFFMWGCVHCFEFEPTLETWREQQPDYVELVHVPAMFSPTARLHAQAFYTAEVLGKLDQMRVPFYEEIHVRGNPLATEAAIRVFFGRFGIDPQTFDGAFTSLAVHANVQRAEELSRRYGVNSTPSIGVNGRYFTNTSMAGEAMLRIVDTLVEAEAREHCRDRAESNCPVF